MGDLRIFTLENGTAPWQPVDGLSPLHDLQGVENVVAAVFLWRFFVAAGLVIPAIVEDRFEGGKDFGR